MSSKDPLLLSDSFSVFFDQITTEAEELNAASDELGTPIPGLNEFLKTLNLGIETWVKFDGDENYGNGFYWQHCIGYAKTGGKWGISISKESGHVQDEENAEFESWPFNEAPRALRIDAIEKLPDLLAKLVTETRMTTAKVRAKADQAKKLTDKIKALSAKRK